jgi:hypothetical protein
MPRAPDEVLKTLGVALSVARYTNKDLAKATMPSVKRQALDECLPSPGATLSKLQSTDDRT